MRKLNLPGTYWSGMAAQCAQKKALCVLFSARLIHFQAGRRPYFFNAHCFAFVIPDDAIVSLTTLSFICLQVMRGEFEESLKISNEIIDGRHQAMEGANVWDRLFEPPNFFGKYRHFLVLEASANTEEDQLQWYGTVESKVSTKANDLLWFDFRQQKTLEV